MGKLKTKQNTRNIFAYYLSILQPRTYKLSENVAVIFVKVSQFCNGYGKHDLD